MLDIYASTFLTATRHNNVCLHELPPSTPNGRRRWFQRRKVVCVDVSKL